MIEPLLALAAAIFGGVGLKVIESVLNRSKVKNDMETQMRAELREDVVGLKEELDKIEAALDAWKKKYYALLLSFNELVVVARSNGLSDEVDRIQRGAGSGWQAS
jgi:seryl-tRNA synthetase